ncbi:TonB family protein [Steroidobacter flavus]|uniref:TonB family protein n=1 Tax=Steroidobacter flavus TaxID=1842136 RepID=A0ABV8T495_9GAMM
MMLEFDRRKEFGRWSSSVLLVGAGHVAVVAGFMLDLTFANAQPEQAAMVVELAPEPAAPPIPPTEIPPGPPQVEARPQPKPEPLREQPKFEQPPEVKTEVPPEFAVAKEEPKEEEEVSDADPADMTASLPTLTAPSDDKPAAPTEGATDAVAQNAERTWESTLLAHLERNKRYPGQAQRRRQEDVIYVRFAMDRVGKVLEFAIERSRGYALLDQEVTALIERSSPLPPPPAEVQGERLELVVPVEFFLRKVAHN